MILPYRVVFVGFNGDEGHHALEVEHVGVDALETLQEPETVGAIVCNESSVMIAAHCRHLLEHALFYLVTPTNDFKAITSSINELQIRRAELAVTEELYQAIYDDLISLQEALEEKEHAKT